MKKTLLITLMLGILMPGTAGAMLLKKEKNTNEKKSRRIMRYEYEIELHETEIKELEEKLKLESNKEKHKKNVGRITICKIYLEFHKKKLEKLKKTPLKKVITKQQSKIKTTVLYCALGSVVVGAVASTLSLIWYIWKRKTK